MSRVMRTSIGTVTQVSIKFVEKEKGKQKDGCEYRTEHKTCSAHNKGRKTGREEEKNTTQTYRNRQTDKEGT